MNQDAAWQLLTASGGTIDVPGLSDGDVVKFSSLPMAPVGERSWLQIEFAQPQTVRGASLAIAGFKWPFGPQPEGPDLESSADGQSFTKVANAYVKRRSGTATGINPSCTSTCFSCTRA